MVGLLSNFFTSNICYWYGSAHDCYISHSSSKTRKFSKFLKKNHLSLLTIATTRKTRSKLEQSAEHTWTMKMVVRKRKNIERLVSLKFICPYCPSVCNALRNAWQILHRLSCNMCISYMTKNLIFLEIDVIYVNLIDIKQLRGPIVSSF